MSTKRENLLNPSSCLNRARPDELIFVICSDDPLAAQTVRHWATMAEGLHEPEKVDRARALADMMEKQRQEGLPKVTPAPTYGGEGYAAASVGQREALALTKPYRGG